MFFSRLHCARLIGTLVLGLLLLQNGCGESQVAVYPVTGKIVFSDQSNARFGNIEFRSEDADPVIARDKISGDGTFKLKSFGGKNGTVAGWHKIVIFQMVGNIRDRTPVVHDHGLEVAEKYRRYQSTPLRVEVRPNGENNFVLEVDEKTPTH